MWGGSTVGRKSIEFERLKVRIACFLKEVLTNADGWSGVIIVSASQGCRSSALTENMALDQWLIEFVSLKLRNWRDIQQYLVMITRFTLLAIDDIVSMKKKKVFFRFKMFINASDT